MSCKGLLPSGRQPLSLSMDREKNRGKTPVLTEQRSLQKVRYWITDQRVIMMNKEKTCYGMELADIDTWKRVRGMSDRDCLVLGSSIFDEVKRQLRWRAVHPKTAGQDQAGRVEGMILYGPEDADGASAILQNVAHESVK